MARMALEVGASVADSYEITSRQFDVSTFADIVTRRLLHAYDIFDAKFKHAWIWGEFHEDTAEGAW
jgi:hypothetical protein